MRVFGAAALSLALCSGAAFAEDAKAPLCIDTLADMTGTAVVLVVQHLPARVIWVSWADRRNPDWRDRPRLTASLVVGPFEIDPG